MGRRAAERGEQDTEGEILGQEGPFRAAWPRGLIHASALPSSPWPHPAPGHLCSSRPCPRAFAHAVSSAGDAFLPFSPESLLPDFPHGLHHRLLREAILISLACPAIGPSVHRRFYTGLGPLILVCLPARRQLPPAHQLTTQCLVQGRRSDGCAGLPGVSAPSPWSRRGRSPIQGRA